MFHERKECIELAKYVLSHQSLSYLNEIIFTRSNLYHSIISYLSCRWIWICLQELGCYQDQGDNRQFIKEKKTLIIIDVRTKEEYDREHFPKAKLINFFGSDFEKKLKGLDKSKAYLLHCQSGGRSRGALRKMQKLGFKEVYHLDGGILAWKKAGGELTD